MPWEDDSEEFDVDAEENGDHDLILCSQCRKTIYEDSEQCPYCGHFVVRDLNWLAQRPKWFQALWIILVGILIVQLIGCWF